jgi:prefoldin alpha subunit
MAKGKKAAREEKSGRPEIANRPEAGINEVRTRNAAATERKEMNLTRDQLIGSFEMERSRYDAVAKRLNMIISAQFEISSTVEALDEIEKSGKGNKILVPLGAGVMIEAGLVNNKEVLFSFAGGTITQKEIPVIRDELKKRLESLKKEYDVTTVERQKIEKGLANIRNIIMLAENNARAQMAAGKGK